MTEIELARELGLIKKRSNSFNNTVILNQRLVNHILSLKKEKEEEIEEFELAEEDIPAMELPTHSVSVEEKIVELKPIPNFVWQQAETATSNVGKGKVILSMYEYKERKHKEMLERLIEGDGEKINFLSAS